MSPTALQSDDPDLSFDPYTTDDPELGLPEAEPAAGSTAAATPAQLATPPPAATPLRSDLLTPAPGPPPLPVDSTISEQPSWAQLGSPAATQRLLTPEAMPSDTQGEMDAIWPQEVATLEVSVGALHLHAPLIISAMEVYP